MLVSLLPVFTVGTISKITDVSKGLSPTLRGAGSDIYHYFMVCFFKQL